MPSVPRLNALRACAIARQSFEQKTHAVAVKLQQLPLSALSPSGCMVLKLRSHRHEPCQDSDRPLTQKSIEHRLLGKRWPPFLPHAASGSQCVMSTYVSGSKPQHLRVQSAWHGACVLHVGLIQGLAHVQVELHFMSGTHRLDFAPCGMGYACFCARSPAEASVTLKAIGACAYVAELSMCIFCCACAELCPTLPL